MNPDALFDIIKSRRSIRRYTEQDVSEVVLRRILVAAQWGPSAHNRQPWRLAVVTNPERRASLALTMGQRFRNDLIRDGLLLEEVEQQIIRKVLSRHKGNITQAARELGLTRTSLYRRLEKYGL